MKRALVSILALGLCMGAARADECDVVAARIVEKTGATFADKNAAGLLQFSLPPYRGLLGCYPEGNSVQIYSDDKYPSPRFLTSASAIASLAISLPASSLLKAATGCRDEYLRDSSFSPQHTIPGAHFQCGGPGFFFSVDGLKP